MRRETKVKMRRWFSWLVRFRGLTAKNSDDELTEIDLDRLDDPARKNTYGGMDHTWTTDLKLNIMVSLLKGQPRLTLNKLQMEELTSQWMFGKLEKSMKGFYYVWLLQYWWNRL